jgi:hypothetical protein
MLFSCAIFLLAIFSSLFGNTQRRICSVDLFATLSQHSSSSFSVLGGQGNTTSSPEEDVEGEDSNDTTGEVDEDIIITDEENTNDDEGVNN